jgi:DNA (cytosine-5)-methyltransferase 1
MGKSTNHVRVGEAAKMLGVTAQTVRNWAAHGRLRSLRHPISQYRLFDRSEIEVLARLLGSTSSNSDRDRSTPEILEQDLKWLRAKTPQARSDLPRIVIGDAFCGGGIFSLGADAAMHRLGGSACHAFGIDFNADALDTYRHNFPESTAILGDITKLIDGDLGSAQTRSESHFLRSVQTPIDVLLGGPPCQGHSDLNNHTRRDDPKNALYVRMARLGELLLPKLIVIENVAGVVHDKSNVVAETSKALTSLGYQVSSGLIELVRIGVPQNRKRFVLIAALGGTVSVDSLKNYTAPMRSAAWALEDLKDAYDPSSIYNSSASHSPENRRRIAYLFEHDLYELPNNERPPCHRDKHHSYKSVYGRMRWHEPAPTITGGFGSTGQGRFVHPLFPRTLTPHEACRLQFVPDFYGFPQHVGRRSMQQIIGNAAPPRLSEVAVLEAFRQEVLK